MKALYILLRGAVCATLCRAQSDSAAQQTLTDQCAAQLMKEQIHQQDALNPDA